MSLAQGDVMANKQCCGSKLLGGIVLIGLTCWGINSCVGQEANTPPGSQRETLPTIPVKTDQPKRVETLNAPALRKAYLSDQAKATRRYRGRTVELGGTVSAANWSPDKNEGLFVVLKTGTKGFVVTAWFDKEHEKAVLELQKGRTVRVQGKVGDVGLIKKSGEIFVSLDECVFVKAR
jgi:hypothetical protein